MNETGKKKKKISETKRWFFEEINKIDKLLAKYGHDHRSVQQNKIKRTPAFQSEDETESRKQNIRNVTKEEELGKAIS